MIRTPVSKSRALAETAENKQTDECTNDRYKDSNPDKFNEGDDDEDDSESREMISDLDEIENGVEKGDDDDHDEIDESEQIQGVSDAKPKAIPVDRLHAKELEEKFNNVLCDVARPRCDRVCKHRKREAETDDDASVHGTSIDIDKSRHVKARCIPIGDVWLLKCLVDVENTKRTSDELFHVTLEVFVSPSLRSGVPCQKPKQQDGNRNREPTKDGVARGILNPFTNPPEQSEIKKDVAVRPHGVIALAVEVFQWNNKGKGVFHGSFCEGTNVVSEIARPVSKIDTADKWETKVEDATYGIQNLVDEENNRIDDIFDNNVDEIQNCLENAHDDFSNCGLGIAYHQNE